MVQWQNWDFSSGYLVTNLAVIWGKLLISVDLSFLILEDRTLSMNVSKVLSSSKIP